MNKVKFYRATHKAGRPELFVETATIRITTSHGAMRADKRTTPTMAEAVAHMARRGYQRGKP